jgi:outer membrane immunogenic protein
MKRLVSAGLIAASWSSCALAADLGPYRPPPRDYEPVYEPARDMPYGWRGFYIGVNGGYGWGDNAVGVSGPTGGSSTSVNLDGWFGGGQVGYNAQFNQLVLGIEADLQAADIGESTSFTGSNFGQASVNVDWFSTLRGRVGYAAGPTLLYFTGGLAFADVDYSVSGSNGITSFAMSSDKIETGYTLGGGIEWAFAPNWSFKTEYLYVDLGDETLTSPGGTFSSTTDLDFHTVRAGLNYKF